MGEKEPFNNFCFDSMLPLDMLAEVASETLKSDPTLGFQRGHENLTAQNNIGKNGVQKRSATNSEVMNLDQIRVLSDKMLIELFSEHSSDEIRKNFSYKCYLMPDKCSEIFSSFGNETKARLQIKSHLLTHIAQLLAQANDPGNECTEHFVAEPLSVRKRRLQDLVPKKKKKGKALPKKIKNSFPKKCIEKKSLNSKSKSIKENDLDRKISHTKKFSKNASEQAIAANVFVAKTHTRLRKNMHSGYIKKRMEKENGFKKLPSALEYLYNAMQKVNSSNREVQEDINKINNSIEFPSDMNVDGSSPGLWSSSDLSVMENSINSDSGIGTVITVDSTECKNIVNISSKSLDSGRKMCGPELLCYPQHDHTYTSINGKTYVLEAGDIVKNMPPVKENRKVNHQCSGVAVQLIIPTPAFPYIYEPLLPHISEIKEIGSVNRRSCDKCFHSTAASNCSVKKCTSSNSSHNSVPPVNKLVRYRKVNRLIIPEEMEPDSEGDENVPMSFAANYLKDKLCEQDVGDEPSSDQPLPAPVFADKNGSINEISHLGERKLALKCIRALRMKKKDERGPLICQICNGKSFTAQATLMYHYRSHAGIKPFVCSVCDATFTRQHSLNYHMLIHNNKSRFICDECGRSFRHPSHYKEHLRRHTGETPYQCTDCSLRFKTRNTYKRHLKTRHGKILTARGIRILSTEEFNKVRTMPRRKASKQSLFSSDVQETQWSNITFSQIPEVKTEILDK